MSQFLKAGNEEREVAERLVMIPDSQTVLYQTEQSSAPASQLALLAFCAAHIPLAMIGRSYNSAATAHALLTLLIGLIWALSSAGRVRMLYWTAYVAGAEVLWRMCYAGVFWEYAKYAVILVLLVSIVRTESRAVPKAALLYVALLVPSAVLTIVNGGPRVSQKLSFNLSGPLSLAICWAFFSNVRLSRSELAQALMIGVAPIVGIASIQLTAASSRVMEFTDQSSYAFSPGVAPNQLSSILGMGALLACLVVLLSARGNAPARAVLLGLMLWFATQAALTFSRGGVYLAGIPIVASLPFILRDQVARTRVFAVTLVVGVLAVGIALPLLMRVTGGAAAERYSDRSLTGRDRIAQADLELWRRNPVFGVGVGSAADERAELVGHRAASHTEFTRLLAEHGLFGLGALLLLIGFAVRRVVRCRTSLERTISVSMLAYAIAYMSIDGMRLVAPAFVFGLLMLEAINEDEDPA